MTYAADLAALGARADAELAAGALARAGLERQLADLAAQVAALTPPPKPEPSPLERPYPGWTRLWGEGFDVPAAAGSAYAAYASAISGYGDTKAYRVGNVSVHDSLLDIALPGGTAAAPGTGGVVVLGPPTSRWGRLYGKFTVRFKAEGASGTGAAFMLWPTSNRWSDGEVDFPEGSFDGTLGLYHHPSPCYPNQAAPVAGLPYCGGNAAAFDTRASWRDWHEASTEWTEAGLRYFLDGELVKTVADNRPAGNHRWTIQTAAAGVSEPGHLLIDWARIDTPG